MVTQLTVFSNKKEKFVEPSKQPASEKTADPDQIPLKLSKKSKLNNMLKNPLFWPAVCLVVIVTVLTGGFFFNIHISWLTVWDFFTDDKTWAKFGVIVAGIMGIAVLINEKLKNMREKTEQANERVGLVEKTTEVISRATYDIQKFIDDIQEENKKYWVQLNETQEQLQEVRNHYNNSQAQIIKLERQISTLLDQNKQDKEKITSLEAQIAFLQAQSIADKQTIANLQSQVNLLRAELDRTKAESDRMSEENKQLKNHYGRRSTDKLGSLSPEVEARYNQLQEGENK